MTDILVLILFVLSGAASGWLGVDLLPIDVLKQVSNVEGFRVVLAIIGFFIGLAAGFVFLQLRKTFLDQIRTCLLYTSPSPRDRQKSRMPSSA